MTRRLRLGVAALAVGVTLGLLAAEVLLRLLVSPPALPAMHRLDYVLPDATEPQRDALTSTWVWWWSAPDGAAHPRWIGPHGFRGDAWPGRARERSRIAVIGDSFVEGLGAPDGATLPERLRVELAARDRPSQVLNLGMGGAGPQHYLPLLRDAIAHLDLDLAVVVIYANDLATAAPDPEAAVAAVAPPAGSPHPTSRLLEVLARLRGGRPIPWRIRPPVPTAPRPLAVGSRFDADPNLRERVEAVADRELRRAMLAGELSPVIAGHLDRSLRGLPLPVAPRPFLAAARRLAADRGVGLFVVYLPTLNQVSDAYLGAQLAISPQLTESASLRGPRYQQQARDLAGACAELGIAFFDATPALTAAEDLGLRLYWPYDGHLRPAGYWLLARELADRLVAEALRVGTPPSAEVASDRKQAS